jgi:hypothetical protein
MTPLINSNGITIKELKELVKDLPETDEYGEDFEVWIETGENLSSPCKEIWRLNKGDIIIK